MILSRVGIRMSKSLADKYLRRREHKRNRLWPQPTSRNRASGREDRQRNLLWAQTVRGLRIPTPPPRRTLRALCAPGWGDLRAMLPSSAQNRWSDSPGGESHARRKSCAGDWWWFPCWWIVNRKSSIVEPGLHSPALIDKWRKGAGLVGGNDLRTQ